MRRIILAVMSNVQGKLQIMSDLFHLEPSKQQTNKTNRTNMDSWKSENFDLLVAIKEKKSAYHQCHLDSSSGYHERMFKVFMAIDLTMVEIFKSGPKWWKVRQNKRHCHPQCQLLARLKSTKAIIHFPLLMLLSPDGTFHFRNVIPLQ